MITIAVALATAQNPIQNLILIIQENRTPDNLFQELCSSSIGCSTSDGTKFNIASSGSCFCESGRKPRLPITSTKLVEHGDYRDLGRLGRLV
jgi:hypothetical protein